MSYSRTSWPPSVTCPASTSQKRESKRQSVVLPPPEGPTMAVVVRSGMSQCDSVDNLLFAIGKRNLICMKIMELRRKFCAGNIHGRKVQNVRCLIHAGIHHPQQARLCAGLLQTFREQEGTDAEHDAVEKLHAAICVKHKRQHHDTHINELGNHILRQHQRHKLQLHVDVGIHIFLDGVVQPAVVPADQGVGLHFGNSLDKLQHLLHHCRVSGKFAAGRLLGFDLQGVIHGVVNGKTGNNEQSDSPIQRRNTARVITAVEKMPSVTSMTARVDTPEEIIHGVGGDGGDSAETVLVEIAHGKIPQMLGNLYALVSGRAVAAVRLQGGGCDI